MKVLNLKSTGIISYVFEGMQGETHIHHSGFSAADSKLFQDQIDIEQSQGFQELHLEKNLTNSLVHRVGVNKFISGKNPEDYEIFNNMKQWVAAVHNVQG